jgi:hypothetical protein
MMIASAIVDLLAGGRKRSRTKVRLPESSTFRFNSEAASGATHFG